MRAAPVKRLPSSWLLSTSMLFWLTACGDSTDGNADMGVTGSGDEATGSSAGADTQDAGTSNATTSPDTGSDSGEVDCLPTPYIGDIEHGPGSDSQDYAGAREIRGNLRIELGAGLELDAFRCLERITFEGEARDGGNLSISGDGQLPATAFERLQSVHGQFLIRDTQGLDALTGLAALASIGWELNIKDNRDLRTIDGLTALTQVAHGVLLLDNPVLEHFNGLSSLTSANEVIVDENPQLTGLGGFSGLATVPKRLKIENNTALTNLAGLEALREVGELWVSGHPELDDLRALAGLRKLEQGLRIERNASLEHLGGLENLQLLGRQSFISDNAKLSDLSALAQLADIVPAAEGMDPAGRLTIARNPALETLAGLDALQQVTGELVIADNPELVSVVGLGTLSQVGSLHLVGPDRLANLDELAALSEVDVRLRIENHPELATVAGLTALESIHSLVLIGPDQLTDVEVFRNATPAHTLVVRDHALLADLDPFSGMTELSGDLTLGKLPLVTALTPFSSLERIAGELMIRENTALADLEALAQLRHVGTLTIYRNCELSTLAGLHGLETIGGSVCIEENETLVSLQAFSQLQEIGYALTLLRNEALPSLEGLHNVKSLGGSLWMDGNVGVTEFSGLRSLHTVGVHLWSDEATVSCVEEGPAFAVPLPRDAPSRHGFMGIELNHHLMEEVTGFDSLQVIRGGLSLKANPNLISLDTLMDLKVEGARLELKYNPLLERDEALDLCESLANNDFLGGDVRIGCNTLPHDPDEMCEAEGGGTGEGGDPHCDPSGESETTDTGESSPPAAAPSARAELDGGRMLALDGRNPCPPR